jgi:hypothetical protein
MARSRQPQRMGAFTLTATLGIKPALSWWLKFGSRHHTARNKSPLAEEQKENSSDMRAAFVRIISRNSRVASGTVGLSLSESLN